MSWFGLSLPTLSVVVLVDVSDISILFSVWGQGTLRRDPSKWQGVSSQKEKIEGVALPYLNRWLSWSESSLPLSHGRWPQTLVFPEGTCTNGNALVQFKLGALACHSLQDREGNCLTESRARSC